MRGLNGKELAERTVKINPNLKIPENPRPVTGLIYYN